MENLIDLLGLKAVQNSIIGDEKIRGISGGEKKRVNIGIQMILYPWILFLDEPTTGLDSLTALKIIKVINNLK